MMLSRMFFAVVSLQFFALVAFGQVDNRCWVAMNANSRLPQQVNSSDLYQDSVSLCVGQTVPVCRSWGCNEGGNADVGTVTMEITGDANVIRALLSNNSDATGSWDLAQIEEFNNHFRVEGLAPGTATVKWSWDHSPVVVEISFHVLDEPLRFLHGMNTAIDPETEALNVSNYVTTVGLPTDANTTFGTVMDDPDNFRIEVVDPTITANSVDALVQVNNDPPVTYTLDKVSGDAFRGVILRLVTDDVDDDASGHGANMDPDDQTILVQLGDLITASYTTTGGTDCQQALTVGRPPDENDNGGNQLLHDIRELTVNVVIFSVSGTTNLNGAINNTQTTIPVNNVATAHPAGTIWIDNEIIEYTGINVTNNTFTGATRGAEGTMAAAHTNDTDVLYSSTTPAVSLAQVNADLDTVDQRLAQSTIRLLRPVTIDNGGGDGHVLPAAMLDGITVNTGFVTNFTDDETEIIDLKDGDANSIDIFYVNEYSDTSVAMAYPAFRNNSTNADGENFVIITTDERVFTVPHEIMHILLDSAHRNNEPGEALFFSPTSAANVVDGTKRIGPFPNPGPGTGDTLDIRANA